MDTPRRGSSSGVRATSPPHRLEPHWHTVAKCEPTRGQTTQRGVEILSVRPMPGKTIYGRLIEPMQGRTASVNPRYQFGFNTAIDATVELIMPLSFTMLPRALLALGT